MVLYALGSNGSGQLGIGHAEDVSSPSRSFTPVSTGLTGVPMQIAAGGNHTLILFSSGRVYIAGVLQKHPVEQDSVAENTFAQLRFGASIQVHAKLCSATWQASIVATTDDVIYTFGIGERGEIGRNDNAANALDMSWLPQDTTIKHIASGLQHTVIVLSNGDVYGWGNGRKGQLGEPRGIILEPRKIEALGFPVARAACGREFTYLVGNPQDGHQKILGSDKWRLKTDAPVNVRGWKDIGASWGSIFVLDHSGQITSWGRNDHGQLAPSGLPAIDKIAVGSEHVLTLTKDGKALTWGWGEHGNCGPAVDADGDVKRCWNEIDLEDLSEPENIAGIGAGCATSWMWTKSL